MAQCSGDCGSCGGCCKTILCTDGEISILQALGQFPFLPIARRADNMIPIYLEETRYTTEEYSLILQALEQKMLISLDYDKPLAGADMGAYTGYPVHGSMALTARGQLVLDMLETQGVQDENN